MAREMEHPGKVWNAIESRVNKYLGRVLPAQAVRWLWVLVHGGLVYYGVPIALFIIVMTGALFSHITGVLLQEQAVHAPSDVLNPANDGKLVKICGRVSIPAPACDPLTGVKALSLPPPATQKTPEPRGSRVSKPIERKGIL